MIPAAIHDPLAIRLLRAPFGNRAFLAARGCELKSEFYLPAAVSELIGRGEASVRVLPTESTWFGVTYREDKPRVQAAIAELVRRGVYPARLF